MVFFQSQLLWFCLLAIPLIALHLRRHPRLAQGQWILVSTLRCVAVLLLLVALARPAILLAPDADQTVLVVDNSTSVAPQALEGVRATLTQTNQQQRDDYDLVLTSERPHQAALNDWLTAPLTQADGSNLAEALRFAGALIEQDGRGHIQLYTDELATGDDVATVAVQLANRGIPINLNTTATTDQPQVLLSHISGPGYTRIGASIELAAEIASNVNTPARVIFEAPDQPSFEQTVTLHPGVQVVRFPWSADQPGLRQFTLRVESDQDTRDDDNTLTAAITVGEPQQIACLVDEATATTADALRKLLGSAAIVESVNIQSDDCNAAIDRADLVVLTDVPATELSRDVQTHLRQRVQDEGLGLLVTGGQRTLGAGGYADTPLAAVLPVSLTQEMEDHDPSTTLVIIIDTSGSMGGPRVSLAKEIARLAVGNLNAHDKVGVVEFYGSKRWAAPIQPASNAIAIQRALNRLSSGGGTVILPALEEAYYALKTVHTRTRHVLVLTDGGIETDAFEPLIRKMADSGITVSTVLVGPGRYSGLMGQIAHWGGGRTYTAPDRYTLPEVIVKQPQSSRLSTFLTGEFSIAAMQPNDVLAGIDLDKAPVLSGYNQVEARPAAQSLLNNSNDAPLLVRWRQGAGAVAVWATQLDGPWTQSLAQWPEYPHLISNLVRSLARPANDAGLDVQTIVRPGGLELDIQLLRWNDAQAATRPLAVQLKRDADVLLEEVVDPIEPGHWNLWVPDLSPGVVQVVASTTDNALQGSAATTIAPEREWQMMSRDAQWPNELATIQNLAQQKASTLAAAPASQPLELWPYCVLIALVLTLLQVLLRRWPIQRSLPTAGVARTASIAALVMAMLWLPAETRAQSAPAESDSALVVNACLEAERSGDLDQALKSIADLLKGGVTPDEQFALQVRAALLYYERGENDAARTALQSAAAARGDDEATQAYCAQLAALAGDPAYAAQHLPPNDTFGNAMFRGLWNLHQGQPQKAEASFAAADQIAERSRDVRLARAFEIVAARAADQLEPLAEAWLASPQTNETKIELLASLLRELGRSEDALKLLRGIQANPLEQDTTQLQQTILAFLIETQREDEAETLYRALLRQKPSEVSLCRGLAHLLLLQERRADASQVFNDAIQTAQEPSTILLLGEAACDLGLYDAAHRAATHAREVDERADLDALIFEAQIEKSRGDMDAALAIVRQAANTTNTSPIALKRLADVLEELGDTHTALTILKKIYEQTNAEDILLRYAWLLESSGNLDEAYTLWKELWSRTNVPARLRQSQDRLLDLAARTYRLADLAIEIEEHLDTGKARERELELLVDLYTHVNDTVSAAEILHQFGRQSGDQIATLKRLVRVYLSCEQFDRCNATLKRLIEIDPDNQADYLQQLAMLAIERQHTADLQEYLKSIQALGSDAQADEISASLLSMAGMYEESVAAYERLMAAHPDRIEAWLTWGNAMRDAGRRPSAIQKFLELLDEADQDDLFAVAADGLLNLEASAPALHYAVRRVYCRIAADPKRILLYRLAADLLEAAGDMDGMHAVLEQSVLIAGDQSAQILRELMDSTRSEGQLTEAVTYSRLLVLIGEALPPQAWLEMGKLLLNQSHVSEAANAFERAAAEGDRAAIYQDIARVYEEADHLTAADHILRELLILTPDDVDVLLRAATLAERQGQTERALRQYTRGVQLQLSHLPSVVEREPQQAPEPDASPSRRNRNVDVVARTLDQGVRGALRCMPDAKDAAAQLLGLPDRVHNELKALRASGSLAEDLDAHPRLSRSIGCLRQLAFANHRPAIADKADRALLDAFPHDAALHSEVVQERLTWGLIDSALALAGDQPDASWPSDLLAAGYASGGLDEVQVLAAVAGDAAKEMDLAARALLTGSHDLLHKVLQQIQPAHKDWSAVASSAITLAIMQNEDALVSQWADAWMTDLLRQAATKDVSRDLADCIETIWPQISADQRTAIAHRIGQLVQGQNGNASSATTRLYTRLADALGMPLFDSFEALQEMSKRASTSDIVWMMRRLDADKRETFLRTVLGNRPPTSLRSAIHDLAGSLIAANLIDEPLADILIKAYRSANEQQTDTKILYTTLSRGSWVDQAQPSQPPAVKHLLGEMAAIVSQEYEATAAGNVVATCVLLGIGERDAGVAAAKKALQLIRSQPTLKYDEVRMLGDLVDAIPRDVLAELVPDQPRDGATETEYFVRAALLEALDRTSDCLAALRTAYERSPENRSINRRLISRSERVGQIAMLAKLLYENLSRSTIMESYEWRTLAHLQLSLFKPADAMSAAQHDASPLGPVTVLQAAMFAGDLDYAWTTLQQFAATGPSAERHWDPTWPDEPSQNGIIGWLAAQQPLHLKRTSLFRAVSELPQVEAAYTDWIRAALPGERNVAGMADGLVDAWRQKGVAAEQLDVLQQLVQDDAATVHDDWLLLQLLSTAPDATAEAATTDYLLASVDLDNYDQLRLLANCHNLPAQAQSDVLLWLMVSGGQYGYRTTRLDQRIDDIKEYIASLPAEARADMTQRLNRFLEPTPLDAPSDSIMAAKLEWLFTVNPVLAETELDACRQQIASNDVLRSYPQTARILARAAAAKQDWEQCRQYVDAALMLNPTRRTTEQVIDTRSLLPDRDAETLEQTVTFVSERLSELYEQSRIARDTYVRSLALLAYACCEREVPELANALRAQIAAQHGEPGEHWLWEADLCRRLGDAPAAHELERTLAMETLLPMTRVARLLAEAEQYGKTGSSERLALRLADVTDHPAVLTRAKAAAQRLQQPEDVAAFDSRLGLWSEAVKKRLEFRISSPESGNKPKAE